MEITVPLSSLHSLFERFNSDFPLKIISPETTFPCPNSPPIIERRTVDLPLPDDPTRA